MVTDEIREYLLSHAGRDGAAYLSDTDSLLEAGLLDSVGMVDLIAHLEGTYGITVAEDDMVPEHFETLQAISSYIEHKRAAAS